MSARVSIWDVLSGGNKGRGHGEKGGKGAQEWGEGCVGELGERVMETTEGRRRMSSSYVVAMMNDCEPVSYSSCWPSMGVCVNVYYTVMHLSMLDKLQGVRD
jgi:hypothetical protein